MDKLIEAIFSNIFIVIVVITGIVKFFNKVTGTDFKPGSEGRTQKPFKESTKKFNVFDFDIEKWFEEQSGQKNNSQRAKSSRLKSAGQIEKNPNNQRIHGSQDLQTNYFVETKTSTAANTSLDTVEDETKKQFEIDLTDMQKAVILSEIIGPPRSKRKSFRY